MNWFAGVLRFGGLICLPLVAGCATPANQLVGLYRTVSCREDGGPITDCRKSEPTIVASLVTIPTPPATAANGGLGLSERALAEYIRVLGTRAMSKTADELRRNLAAQIAAPAGTGLVDDRGFKRTLILTIRKDGRFNPDDRLEDVHATIKLQGARFVNWDAAATVYTTINAGSIQLTNTVNSQAGLAIGAPAGAPISATINGSVSRSSARAETLPETFQVENLTITVEGENSQELHIRRQGGQGVDLTGNVVVKLELLADLPPASNGSPIQSQVSLATATNLFGKDGQPSPASKVSLSFRDHRFAPAQDITAQLTVRYVMRHILHGGGTGASRDQDVLEDTWTYPLPPRGPAQFTFVPQREIGPGSFGLFNPVRSEFVVARYLNQKPASLCFASMSEADNFLTYLRARPATYRLGSTVIGSGDSQSPVSPLQEAELEILTSTNNCH